MVKKSEDTKWLLKTGCLSRLFSCHTIGVFSLQISHKGWVKSTVDCWDSRALIGTHNTLPSLVHRVRFSVTINFHGDTVMKNTNQRRHIKIRRSNTTKQNTQTKT